MNLKFAAGVAEGYDFRNRNFRVISILRREMKMVELGVCYMSLALRWL